MNRPSIDLHQTVSALFLEAERIGASIRLELPAYELETLWRDVGVRARYDGSDRSLSIPLQTEAPYRYATVYRQADAPTNPNPKTI